MALTAVGAVLALPTTPVSATGPVGDKPPEVGVAEPHCDIRAGCLRYTFLEGTDPLAGKVAAVSELDEATRGFGIELIRDEVSAHNSPDLQAAFAAIERGDAPAAQLVLDRWVAIALAGRTPTQTSVMGAAGAGIGYIDGGDVWRFEGTRFYAQGGVYVAFVEENWRQYLSEPSSSTTHRTLGDFRRVDGSPNIKITKFVTTCREDLSIDKNCPSSPSWGAMGTFTWGASRDTYWSTPRNSTKRFMNFDYNIQLSGYSGTWSPALFTSYRFKCNFSSPYCSWTGAS